MKDFKVLTARSVEGLVEELKTHSFDDWVIEAYFQEFGVTKILISKSKES